MVARQKPHDFATLRVNTDVGTKGVHHINAFGLGQFPRAGGERVGLGHQCANGAQINDVALHITVQRFTQIAGDFRIFAAAGLAHLRNSCDFGGEAHAARA